MISTSPKETQLRSSSQHTHLADRVSQTQNLVWLELMKALALLWICLNHVVERLLGAPYFANPESQWPPLSTRITQFVHGFGSGRGWDALITAIRDLGWTGDQGVSLFLLLSGLALAWSCSARSDRGELRWREFFSRRFLRIYPIWIVAHLLILFPLAFFAVKLSILNPRLWFSLVGLRLWPGTLYFAVPAWWFITLLLQLYLVFPILWGILQRIGLGRFTVALVGLSLATRAVGILSLTHYLDAWSRGAIFVSRLSEFVIGISIGYWLYRNRTVAASPVRTFVAVIGLVCFGVGFAASFTLTGMVVAPALQGFGAFALLYSLFCRVTPSRGAIFRAMNWIGRHSLSLFLVHQLFVNLLIPEDHSHLSGMSLLCRLLGIAILSVTLALILEWATQSSLSLLSLGSTRWGTSGLLARAAFAFGILWVVLISAELAVRRFAPQEPRDIGWGERNSLQADPVFGWKLQPGKTTQLRWTSYDYKTSANSLGFPAPEYSAQPQAAQRILVTGDAFTSAEGVDTERSWPRLLEADLSQSSPKQPVEVLNFGITGYGPNQYAAVVNQYVPRYKPNLVIIGLFINDYEDTQISNQEFQKSIGFSNPNPDGLAALLSARQFAALVRLQATKFLYQNVLHRPDPNGFFLGEFLQLQPGPESNVARGRQALRDRLAEIKSVTDRVGSRLVILMIPSAPQVCPANTLNYWPKFTSLADPKFDPDLPQRTTIKISKELAIEAIDLRPVLRSAPTCPYQPNNMHWTAAGHQLVARHMADLLRLPGAGS
jgi:peptidoglycan/LPS O-acetylase OafA/YrhL/lysophospholipase L1-like esterase